MFQCPYCYSKRLNAVGICADCGKDSKPVEKSIGMIHPSIQMNGSDLEPPPITKEEAQEIVNKYKKMFPDLRFDQGEDDG